MSAVPELCPRGQHSLVLFSQSFDSEPHLIAGLQIVRRFLSHAYTGRSSCRNDVARLQTHEAAEIADEMRYAEDHGASRSVLIVMAVDFQPHLEILRVRDFVRRHQPRADGTEGVGALALYPLAGTFQLEGSFRKIVDYTVAGHVRHCFSFAHVFRRFADDDS